MILGIKAIGNAGLYDCMPALAEVLENKGAKEILRVQAIWAIRKIANIPKAKKEVCGVGIVI